MKKMGARGGERELEGKGGESRGGEGGSERRRDMGKEGKERQGKGRERKVRDGKRKRKRERTRGRQNQEQGSEGKQGRGAGGRGERAGRHLPKCGDAAMPMLRRFSCVEAHVLHNYRKQKIPDQSANKYFNIASLSMISMTRPQLA